VSLNAILVRKKVPGMFLVVNYGKEKNCRRNVLSIIVVFKVFAARFSYPSRRGPICKSDLDILNGSPNWTWSESRCWHFFSYVLHIAKYALRLIN
jgi:hypothetical protein